MLADQEEPEGFYIEKIIPGTPVKEMLALVQYFPNDLLNRMNKHVRSKIQSGQIKSREGMDLLDRYEHMFSESTYFKRPRND